MIVGLLPLLALGLAGYVALRVMSGRRHPETGELLEGDTRELVVRVFRLTLLAAGVVLVAEGVAALIAVAIPRGDELARDPLEIAQALSFTVVGVPALAGLAWWTRRRLTDDPDEQPSFVWAAYLGGVVIVALLVVVVNLYQVAGWAVGDNLLNRRAIGRVVSWSIVLGGHWVLNRERPLVDEYRRPQSRTPVHLLVGSGIGLAATAFSGWEFVRELLRPLYDELAGTVVLAGSPQPARAGAHAVIGLAVWLWWWWFGGRRSTRDNRWYGYVLLVGVLGGLVATVSAAGVMVHSVLQWVFGDPASSNAAMHFGVMPGSVAALAVGAGVWIHHRLALGERGRRTRTEIDRVYDYLVAFAGLVLSAVAVTLVVSAFVEAVTDTGAADRSIANPIVAAVTFVVLGVPLWALFWFRAERYAAVDRTELSSISRRVYVIVTLGVSALVALISMVIMLTIFFEDVAGGEFGGETLRRLRVPLGLVLSTVLVAVYHVLVYRDDRNAAPPPLPPAPPGPVGGLEHLVMVSDLPADAAEPLARRLAGSAGTVQYRTGDDGPLPSEESVDTALADLGRISGRRALVTVSAGTLAVKPLVD